MKSPVERFLSQFTPVVHDGQFVFRNIPAQGLVDAVTKTLDGAPAPARRKKKSRKKKATHGKATDFTPST